MLSDEQIQRLIDLEKEEMVLVTRKMDLNKTDSLSNEDRIEIERADIRIKEIEEEVAKIKELPKAITRDQLAREMEVSNRTENEIIDEHSQRIEKKRREIEEQIRKYVDENNLR